MTKTNGCEVIHVSLMDELDLVAVVICFVSCSSTASMFDAELLLKWLVDESIIDQQKNNQQQLITE